MKRDYELTEEERDLLDKLIDRYVLEEIIHIMKSDEVTIDEVNLEEFLEEYTNEIFFSRLDQKDYYEEEIKKLGILGKNRKIKDDENE